jgi:diaminopimelate decarboxylase
VPDLESIFSAAEDLLESAWGLAPRPSLIFEPGRALAGPHVSLFCTVVSVKQLRGTQIVTLDTGINSLPFARHFAYPIKVFKEADGSLLPTILCGPLCMSDDILRSNVKLAKLEEGDILSFAGVGAYNLSMAFNFILPFAPIYVKDKGEFRRSKLMFSA